MKTQRNLTARRALLTALNAMPPRVEADCVSGFIWTEADLQYSIVKHLRDSLSTTGSARWFIASNHALHDVRPDVACYFIEGDFGKFVLNPSKYLVGVIEIKIASSPAKDLPKLAIFQRKSGCIAWIVYGDHFSGKIHKAFFAAQLQREKAIQRWRGTRRDRGFFILKTAGLEATAAAANRKIIRAFNKNYWRHDN